MVSRGQVPTYTAEIYIGGDFLTVCRVCREWAYNTGACVTVEPVAYIYTGATEDGVRVGLINYPRFPADPDDIFKQAEELAGLLILALCQHSYSIVASDRTLWVSRREV